MWCLGNLTYLLHAAVDSDGLRYQELNFFL